MQQWLRRKGLWLGAGGSLVQVPACTKTERGLVTGEVAHQGTAEVQGTDLQLLPHSGTSVYVPVGGCLGACVYIFRVVYNDNCKFLLLMKSR